MTAWVTASSLNTTMYGLFRSPAKTMPAGAATASRSRVRNTNLRVERPLGRSLSDSLVFIVADATDQGALQTGTGGTGGRQDLGMGNRGFRRLGSAIPTGGGRIYRKNRPRP